MTREAFIEEIAKYICKHAPEYGIKVCSPIIAQAILESGYGTSEKAAKYHNYFGLKFRSNRCPTSNGTFTAGGSEQNPDGTYRQITDRWFRFPNMEAGVLGYFDFINISNYQNLKGITDPRTYLETIKADKYSTSQRYVENNMNIVNQNNLTRFDGTDKEKEEKKMVFNVHAGHNPDGKVACGAVGFIQESTQARIVKNEVIRQLQLLGHTVYDCTVDDGKSQGDVLSKIVSKCNAHKVDLDISIHFNSGAKDYTGNGQTTGTECYIYSNSSVNARKYAEYITANLSALGFKNRGVKVNPSLYVLKNTNAEAVLIEVCFVDDADDVLTFNAFNVASAIVHSITGGQTLPVIEVPTAQEATVPEAETPQGKSDTTYRVQVGAYKTKANAEKMVADLKVAGFNAFITEA